MERRERGSVRAAWGRKQTLKIGNDGCEIRLREGGEAADGSCHFPREEEKDGGVHGAVTELVSASTDRSGTTRADAEWIRVAADLFSPWPVRSCLGEVSPGAKLQGTQEASSQARLEEQGREGSKKTDRDSPSRRAAPIATNAASNAFPS